MQSSSSVTHPNPESPSVKSALFRADIEQALRSLHPNRVNAYRNVFVLMASFVNSPECHIEQIGLADVFNDIYHFRVQFLRIPIDNTAQRVFDARIDATLSSMNKHDLLIFHYGGHGSHDYDLGIMDIHRPLLLCSDSWDDPTGEKDDWGNTKKVCAVVKTFKFMDKHKVDMPPPQVSGIKVVVPEKPDIPEVLLILDCCYAGSEAVTGRFELLAACGIGLKTAGPSDTASFTFNLVQLLKQLNGRPATVAQIYGQLIRHFYEGGLATTPFHVELSDEMIGKGSIILTPIVHGSSVIPPHLRGVRPFLYTDGPPTVLLSIALTDLTAQPNADQWVRWLSTNTPPEFQDMKIEVLGFYRTQSGVLMVAMPAELWAVLKGRLAYKFLGHRAPERPAAELSVRAKGKENIPYRSRGTSQAREAGGPSGSMAK